MKTPITYYGGKQRMLRHILPLLPEHRLYAEPFAGGAAVFFAKQPSAVEVLNDTNRQLITFYEVAKTQYQKLKKKIEATLHGRENHRYATIIYNNSRFFGKVDIAWSVWVLAASSFSSMLDGSFGFEKSSGSITKRLRNKRDNFTTDISRRLENVQLECRDAVALIEAFDSEFAFFYCDPPYFNSDMGHYGGYTKEDFERLLKALSKIKGKFLLSSYPSELLLQYAKENGWQMIVYEKKVAIHANVKRKKQEVLTANYPISDLQLNP